MRRYPGHQALGQAIVDFASDGESDIAGALATLAGACRCRAPLGEAPASRALIGVGERLAGSVSGRSSVERSGVPEKRKAQLLP